MKNFNEVIFELANQQRWLANPELSLVMNLAVLAYQWVDAQTIQIVRDLLAKDDEEVTPQELQVRFEEEFAKAEFQDELQSRLPDYVVPEFTSFKLLTLAKKKQLTSPIWQAAFQSIQGENEATFQKLATELSENGTFEALAKPGIYEAMTTGLAKLKLAEISRDDLGRLSEMLIEATASLAGKKTAGFSTPQALTKLLAKLTLNEQQAPKNIYDGVVGTGGFLTAMAKQVINPEQIELVGKDLNLNRLIIARLNLFLHGVTDSQIELRASDIFDDFNDQATYDAVLMDPPYAVKIDSKLLEQDTRFNDFGIPPRLRGDLGFLLEGLFRLNDGGTMTILLPHGALFRGAAEAKIRQKLITKGYLKAVIGLPSGLLTTTGISVALLVLQKQAKPDGIFFIDASKDYQKARWQNVLRDEDIEKIVTTYQARKDVPQYAHLASLNEIEANDFNLNIPRYVDTFVPEPLPDMETLGQTIITGAHRIVDYKHRINETVEALSHQNVAENQEIYQVLQHYLKRKE